LSSIIGTSAKWDVDLKQTKENLSILGNFP